MVQYLLEEYNDIAPGYGDNKRDLQRKNSHILEEFVVEICFVFCIQDDSDQYGATE